MGDARPAESDDVHYFAPNDLGTLQDISEKVEELAVVARARVVVAVWDRGDARPVAWIEVHPEDSDPTVRFVPEVTGPPPESTGLQVDTGPGGGGQSTDPASSNPVVTPPAETGASS